MLFHQLFDPETSTYTYLVADVDSRQALLIDPVIEQLERDAHLVEELGLTLSYVLETHVHADHVTAAAALRDRFGAKAVGGVKGAACADLHVRDGDTLALGALRVRVIETPGHTDDSLSYLVEDHVFTGDALLVRGTGRTDFQNGDAATLYASITERLFTLPDETRVYPGHDYRGMTASTIGEEKRHNPRLAGKSLADFVVIMDSLGLSAPKKIQIAVPRNRVCGNETVAV